MNKKTKEIDIFDEKELIFELNGDFGSNEWYIKFMECGIEYGEIEGILKPWGFIPYSNITNIDYCYDSIEIYCKKFNLSEED